MPVKVPTVQVRREVNERVIEALQIPPIPAIGATQIEHYQAWYNAIIEAGKLNFAEVATK